MVSFISSGSFRFMKANYSLCTSKALFNRGWIVLSLCWQHVFHGLCFIVRDLRNRYRHISSLEIPFSRVSCKKESSVSGLIITSPSSPVVWISFHWTSDQVGYDGWRTQPLSLTSFYEIERIHRSFPDPLITTNYFHILHLEDCSRIPSLH